MKRALSIILIFTLLISMTVMLSACGDSTPLLYRHQWVSTNLNTGEITLEFTVGSNQYSGSCKKTVRNINGGITEDEDPWDYWETHSVKLTLKSLKKGTSASFTYTKLDEKDLANGINNAEKSQWYVSDNYLVLDGVIYIPAD